MSHSVTKTKLRHSPNRSSAFCLYSSRYLSLRENSLLLRLASSVSSLVLQWSDNLWGIRTPPLWTDFLTRQALQIVYSAVLHSCYIKVKIRSTYSNVCWSPWNLGKALLTGIRPLLFCPKTKQNKTKRFVLFLWKLQTYDVYLFVWSQVYLYCCFIMRAAPNLTGFIDTYLTSICGTEAISVTKFWKKKKKIFDSLGTFWLFFCFWESSTFQSSRNWKISS